MLITSGSSHVPIVLQQVRHKTPKLDLEACSTPLGQVISVLGRPLQRFEVNNRIQGLTADK